MRITPNAWQRGHGVSALCRQIAQTRLQAEQVRAATRARTQRFTIDGEELKSVETFKYLGRIVSSTDNDWPALQRNLTKARQRWGMISRVLRRHGANARISGKFYKAAVLTILLYSSETWVWTKRMWKAANSFHVHVARCLSGRRARFQNGSWVWPPVTETLQACRLQPLAVYIDRRRRHIQPYLEDSQLYATCLATPRKPGTPTGLRFYWEQQALPGQNGQADEE